MSNDNSGLKPFLLGTITGGIVGAVVALLYAPREGAETRRDLCRKIDDITETVNGLVAKAKSKAEPVVTESKARAEEMVDRTRERADGLIQDAERAIREARKRTTDGSETPANSSQPAE